LCHGRLELVLERAFGRRQGVEAPLVDAKDEAEPPAALASGAWTAATALAVHRWIKTHAAHGAGAEQAQPEATGSATKLEHTFEHPQQPLHREAAATDGVFAAFTVCNAIKEAWPAKTAMLLACPYGTIGAVLLASYGGRTAIKPGAGRMRQCAKTGTNPQCHAPESASIVRSRCMGRRNCRLPLDIFPDACPGLVKWLTVVVSCTYKKGAVSVDTWAAGVGAASSTDRATSTRVRAATATGSKVRAATATGTKVPTPGPTPFPAATSINTIALLRAPGLRPVQETVRWVHSDWVATTAQQFATNCSWTPLQRLPAHESIPTLWYDFLSDLYQRAIETGHQYSIVDGGLMCLYREGRICAHDSDMDFYFRDKKGMKEVYDHLTAMPKYKKLRHHDHACCAATNVEVPMREQMGVGCTCYLPDGRKTGCTEDVAGYASWHYGPAWWLPLEGGKASIVTGHERRKMWAGAYARSIAKSLDSNGNGWIEAAEVQERATQMHVTPAQLKQTLQHLNFVLQLNRDGCDDEARCSRCARFCDINCDNHVAFGAWSKCSNGKQVRKRPTFDGNKTCAHSVETRKC
jgi:hypothetical protein